MCACLNKFAHYLDGRRPSVAQLEISPAINHAIVRTLEWVAEEARKMECPDVRCPHCGLGFNADWETASK